MIFGGVPQPSRKHLTFLELSDARLKQNIEPLDGALVMLSELTVREIADLARVDRDLHA